MKSCVFEMDRITSGLFVVIVTLINKVNSILFLIFGYTSSKIILIGSVKSLDIQVLEAILRELKTFILTVTVASF